MNIGERIRILRQNLNMSMDELANILGKNKATIYRYEKGGINTLPLDILRPLADALQTTPEYLLGWNDEDAVNVGDIAKMLRLKNHMDLEEYSKEIEISVDDLKKYESGERCISRNTMEKMINYSPVKNFKQWSEEFSDIAFDDCEYNKIAEYTRFLLYLRKNKGDDNIC